MNVNQFTRPDRHPFDMLRGYTNASEKEQVLAWILQQCLDAGEWIIVGTAHAHPTMVGDGLLERHGIAQYSLTEKAKGLLYAEFHK